MGGMSHLYLPFSLEHLQSRYRSGSAEGCPRAAVRSSQAGSWHASAFRRAFSPFVQAVAHAAVETHLNVPEGLTLPGLAKGAARALRACQRWEIPFQSDI